MRTPIIRLSESARRALQEAAGDAGGDPLRMRISYRFEYDLFFGARAEADLAVNCDGITIVLDPSSAAETAVRLPAAGRAAGAARVASQS